MMLLLFNFAFVNSCQKNFVFTFCAGRQSHFMTIKCQAACVAEDTITRLAQKLMLYNICQRDIGFEDTSYVFCMS